MRHPETAIEIEINKLCDALDVIAEYEAGDSIDLKIAIRARIAELEQALENEGEEDEEEMNEELKAQGLYLAD